MTGGSRGRWPAIIAASSLLVIGAAAGVTADRLVSRHSPRPIEVRFAHTTATDLLEQALGLRGDQRERVAAILATRQSSIDSVWLDTHNRLQSILSGVVDQIAAELDSDQLARFHELVGELHRTPTPPPH
jgi:hypothetical protein